MSFGFDRPQDHPQAHAHWAAARMAAAVQSRVADSHDARDPDIQTATIDMNGALSPTQSSIRIPPEAYVIAPHVGDVGPGDVVVIVWADRDMNRIPYIVANMSGGSLDIATYTPDALILNTGQEIDAFTVTQTVQSAWAQSHPLDILIPSGTPVLIAWAGFGVFRRAYVIACI